MFLSHSVLLSLLITLTHGTHTPSSQLSPRYTFTHNTILNIHCSDFFGHPSNRDCENILANQILDELGTSEQPLDDLYRLEAEFFEFVGVGAQPHFGHVTGKYYTPIYYAQGNCKAAIFIDRNKGPTDVDSWFNIHDALRFTTMQCVTLENMGGYTDNVGIETKSLILYLFAEDSDFDKILNIKLRCPACDSQQCPAKIGNNSPCSNNPNVSENPEPIIDPTDLSTIPQSGYQQFNPNGNEEQVCNVACKSDNDCMCSDYQCIMDTTVIGRLRKVTKECVFVVLAAGAASIVNGGKGARDIGRVELLEE